jgi:nucleoid DNA-binding protein
MTKKEIVRQIAANMGIEQTKAKEVVQRCLDSIIEIVVKEGRIELRNFGVFEVKQRAARKARNPRTNAEVIVPARRVLTFQVGKNVAKRLDAAGSA